MPQIDYKCECGKKFEPSWKFCPICAKEKVKDDLELIFDKHRNKYKSGIEWQEAIMKDLRMWKSQQYTITWTNQCPPESVVHT